MRALTLAFALFATSALAGVDEAVDEVILPGLARFDAAAAALAETAAADCRADTVAPAYQAAWEAWAPIGDIRLGPSETGALSIVFWPDARGFTPKTLRGLIADPGTVLGDPAAYAEVSIAARGLTALDMLLYDQDFAGYRPDSPTCLLVQTVTADLANQAAALDAGWQDFAEVLKSHGSEGNVSFLDESEAMRAIYTQIMSGLEFTKDSRIGRPLGTFDQPRPTRAEAWRSGRSLANVEGVVHGAVALAEALAGHGLPATRATLDGFDTAARKITDPAFGDVEEDGSAWFRLEVLQQQVGNVQDAIAAEVGTALGLSAGFNSQDGD